MHTDRVTETLRERGKQQRHLQGNRNKETEKRTDRMSQTWARTHRYTSDREAREQKSAHTPAQGQIRQTEIEHREKDIHG